MDKIQIILEKKVDEDRLISQIRAKFPILADPKSVQVAVKQQDGKRILEINTGKIAVDEIKKIIVGCLVREEEQQEEACEYEVEMKMLLDAANKVPWARQVLIAFSAVIVEAGKKTEQTIKQVSAEMAEKVASVDCAVIDIRAEMTKLQETITAANAKNIEETISMIAVLNEKISGLSAMWTLLKDAVNKEPEKK